MSQKQVDDRIRNVIENCAIAGHRSLFVIVGKEGRDTVAILPPMLPPKKNSAPRKLSVLWCFKNLGFPRDKKINQKLCSLTETENELKGEENDNSLESFISSNDVSYCNYSEVPSILGKSFKIAVLQDFEALTPNILACIVETVEGGGLIIILLQTLKSLKQVYTMDMDVHAHYKTVTYKDIICRFNERFILSLSTCSNCLVIDDKLTILPISSNVLSMTSLSPKIKNRHIPLKNSKLIHSILTTKRRNSAENLIYMCRTFEQGKVFSQLTDLLSERAIRTTVSLRSARGRGKSAVLGIAVAAAIIFGYTNIKVVAPHPEDVQTVFRFTQLGVRSQKYAKQYTEFVSTRPELKNAVIKAIIIGHGEQQLVEYCEPSCVMKFTGVELVVIDEAAAIPLPYIEAFMGPHLVFMASTINGYERSGMSLSLKLTSCLRKQVTTKDSSGQRSQRSCTGRVLTEIQMTEPVLYSNGDKVEDWLNRLLCLDVVVPARKLFNYPAVSDCKLYYVNRDTLFSYNQFAEKFLRKLVSILRASQCKNSPDDLLVMSDAPAHHIFCLCAPSSKKLPEVLCVLQVCIEGKLSDSTVRAELQKRRLETEDYVSWLITEECTKENIFSISGARIVQIATHPAYQKKGYGLHAVKLLQEFFEGKFITDRTDVINMIPVIVKDESEPVTNLLEEKLEPKSSLSPLLYELDQFKPEILDYLAVSYGVTLDLLRFWKKAGFCPVYLSHIPVCPRVKFFTLNNALDIEMLKKICSNDRYHLPTINIIFLARFYFSHQFPFVPIEKNEKIALFAIGILQQFYLDVFKQLKMKIEQLNETLCMAFVKVTKVVLQLLRNERCV